MFQWIEKLRAKPEKQKKQIAFLAALFLAGIMFVVWLSVIYPNFREKEAQEAKVADLEPSPFSTFTSQLSSGISAIGDKFSEIKNTVGAFSTDPVYYSATSTATTTSSEPVIR